MPLNTQKKKEIVTNTKKTIKKAQSLILANLNGVSTNKINELRKKSRTIGVHMKIMRNTLLKLAIKETIFSNIKKKLTGPVLAGYSMRHPGSAARLFLEFKKNNPSFKIVGAIFENKSLSDIDIQQLANMPTYQEAIIRLLLTMKEISLGKLLRTFIAIKNQKSFIN